MSAEIEALSKRIGAEYMTLDGHPIFRLVWSDTILENRHGTFREFTESGIFIREVTETKRVRKYNYIHNRWIFEMWAPGNLVANPETPDAISGDYVPVYVFEDRGGNYLPPNEKVIRFLISALHGRVKHDEVPSQEYLEEREIAQTVESMDDHPSWFQTRPGAGRNAIAYAGGLPRWDVRRATVLDQDMVRNVEREAVLRVKEAFKKQEQQADLKKEEIRSAIQAREKTLEEKRNRDEEMNKIKESQMRFKEMQERAAKAAAAMDATKAANPIPVVAQPFVSGSPMHQERKK